MSEHDERSPATLPSSWLELKVGIRLPPRQAAQAGQSRQASPPIAGKRLLERRPLAHTTFLKREEMGSAQTFKPWRCP